MFYTCKTMACIFKPRIEACKTERGDTMKNPLGIALIAVGILLIAFGISSSESLGSEFSKFFTGSPSEKSIWLLIAGVASLVTGAALTMRARHS